MGLSSPLPDADTETWQVTALHIIAKLLKAEVSLLTPKTISFPPNPRTYNSTEYTDGKSPWPVYAETWLPAHLADDLLRQLTKVPCFSGPPHLLPPAF